MKKNSSDKIKTALIDLYLTFREYSLEAKDQKKEENIEYLSSMNELELIKYIKDSIDTVILTLAEKKINEFNNQISNEHVQQDYEAMLIKYEQDIRGHIKVEHQLKLYSDSLQNNIDELEKEKKSGFNNNEKNKEYVNEISNLKKEIKYQKKLIKSYEEQNSKYAENEKKLKNLISKNEKKYKNDIDILNKKIQYYIDKIQMLNAENTNFERTEKRKNETISCTNSHRTNNSNIIRNFMFENEINNNMNSSINGGGLTRIYRNSGNNMSIGDNHSTAITNSRPYVKVDKYILNKYIKKNNNNKEPYQYHTKMKNIKNASCDYGKDVNINLRNNSLSNNINIPNNTNNSYILDSKAQDDILNKFMMNDTSGLIKNKKIYNRHKSIENKSNYIKGKHLNIKKILLSNNINNSNLNSERNSYKDITKGVYNRSIVNKKSACNSTTNSVNGDKNYMNKTAKEININNIIESKNNIRCNFVNNINIYSNNLKQDNNGNNIYISNNSKKFNGNSSFRGVIKNHNLNATNYIHIKGNNKNNMVTYRNNKQKEGKMISSLTNTTQKKY